MKHTNGKSAVNLSIRLSLAVFICVLTFAGCSEDSGNNHGTVTKDSFSASLPDGISTLAVDETTLVISVVVDGGNPQACANLSVNTGAGTYSCNLGLEGGEHTLSLIFSYNDATHGLVQIGTTSGISVTVVVGQTTEADFSGITTDYDDTDTDGINNLNELLNGWNPFVVNTPTISIGDSIAPNNDFSLPFGAVTVGNSSQQTITITNSGNNDLNIGQLGDSDPLAAPYTLSSDNCSGQTLSPQASCDVTVNFAPNASGASNDSFDIPSNDPDNATVTVNVSGTGNPAPIPNIVITDDIAPNNDRLLAFGNLTVGSTSNHVVTITNAGTADLMVGTIGNSDALAPPYAIVANNCSGQTLQPQDGCSITVQYAPLTIGTSINSFNIPSNDPDEPSITVNVNGTGQALASNLKAYFPFSGNTNDESGNGNHGSLTSGSLTSDKAGNINSAYQLGSITVPDSNSLDVQNFTLITWFRMTAVTSAFNCLIGKDYTTGYAIGVDSGGTGACPAPAGVTRRMRVYVGDNVHYFTPHFECNTWYHVAVTYNNSTGAVQLYVNGSLADSASLPASSIQTNTYNLGIGRDGRFGDQYTGVMDEVRIYNSVLTAGEINAIYNQ